MSVKPNPPPQGAANMLAIPVSPGDLKANAVPGLLNRDDPVILNVGANCGQTVGWLLDVLPKATIFAFEPEPRAIANFRLNIDSPQVQLFECAVGAINGTVTFHQSCGGEDVPGYEDGSWDMSGSIRRPLKHLKAFPSVRFESQIQVPIMTLDTWAQQHQVDHVDLIFADVQGAESDLVQGASRLLRFTRYFYTEYDNNESYEGQLNLAQLAQMLPDFEIVCRFESDVLFRNKQYQ